MLKTIKKFGLLVLVAGIVIFLDQVTKTIIRQNLSLGETWTPFEFLPFFRIVNWENTGAAFGFFQGGGLIFAVLAVIVSVIIIIYYPQIPEHFLVMRIAVAMQMGGAIGNLIDRIVFGPVTDFIAVGSFPVFNIADASITIGVALLLLNLWVEERKQKNLQQLDQPSNSESQETLLDHQHE